MQWRPTSGHSADGRTPVMLEAKIVRSLPQRLASRPASTGPSSAATTSTSPPASWLRDDAERRHGADHWHRPPGYRGLRKPSLPAPPGPLPPPPWGKAFRPGFQSKDFAAWSPSCQSGDIQVLSNPRIATLNNRRRCSKVGSDDYFVTNISTSTTTSGTGTVTTPTITP